MMNAKYDIRFSVLYIVLSSITVYGQQVRDTNFLYQVKNPVYKKGQGPVITIDEAHFNLHTLAGLYNSFGNILDQDGYILKSSKDKFTLESLSKTKILVVSNAIAAQENLKLPTLSAFTKAEIADLQQWVSQGGSLFLIADHMPFAGAASEAALSFGFNFINGFSFPKTRKGYNYSREKKTLLVNTITEGRNKSEQIDSIKIFPGQAFIAPENATIISKLNDDYFILLPQVSWQFNDSTTRISGLGFDMGAFMDYGKGRIVVFAEASLFSAQLVGKDRSPMGMNYPGANQNPQLLLNIIHWLDRKL